MSQHPRPDEAPDERSEGLLGPDEDPRVEALLHAVSARLTEPPDELTARRHLSAIRREARRRGLLWHVTRRTAGAAAVAVIVAGLLAGGGLLPDDLQRGVANTAAKVGIELPRPATPTDAGDRPERPDPADDREVPAEGDRGEPQAPTSVDPPAPEHAPVPERAPEDADDHGRSTSDDAPPDDAVTPPVPPAVDDLDEPPVRPEPRPQPDEPPRVEPGEAVPTPPAPDEERGTAPRGSAEGAERSTVRGSKTGDDSNAGSNGDAGGQTTRGDDPHGSGARR